MALRNIDLSDREILLVIDGLTKGSFSSADLATALGVGKKNGISPAGRVAARLAWMVRLGQLDNVDPESLGLKKKDGKFWIMTPLGQEILKGQVPQTVLNNLKKTGTRVAVMRELARRGYTEAGRNDGAALRREWIHQISKERR